jgi:ligand-binding sensor domain-containing protein
MGRILSAFLMLGISSMCGAQIYKYLGIEDGLSNRRIYRIQKDGRGYMWFLTQEGMDRYDGKRIRHYTVLDGNLKVAPQVNLNWLYTDTENTLWVVGRKGRIFHYDTLHDRFRMVYRIPGLQDDFATGMLCYAYMDRGDRIWLCQGDHIIRYDTRTGIAQRLVSRLRGDITAISETDGTNLFIGTVNGLFPVRERDGVLEALADTDSIRTPVSELYYHPGSKKLFVGTFRKGILVYGVSAGSTLRNVAVNRITPLNDRELLIATGGRGVYRMDMDSLVPKPYITADYASHNGMNGDNINDIYVDGGDRIWLANYPAGVTIRNNRYQSYEWFRHSPGNSRSLVNDQVHDVIEDSEGDLWFATSNGISLLQPAVGRWRSFLSRSDGIQDGGNHIFLTLCEVSPGVICAGGYASGLYRIEKKTERVEYFPPPPLQQRGVQTSISMTSEKILEDVYGQGAATISNVSIPMTAQYACTRSRAPSPPYWRRLRNGCGSVPAWGCTCLTGTGGPADISHFQSRRFMSMHCTRHRTGSCISAPAGRDFSSMTAWRTGSSANTRPRTAP